MAPVTATAVGMARQTIDDPELVRFLAKLSSFEVRRTPSDEKAPPKDPDDKSKQKDAPVDIEGLVEELKKCPSWRFQEQADLYEWIRPLDAMDAALTHILESHPALLLIGRESGVCSKRVQPDVLSLPPVGAQSIAEIQQVPQFASSVVVVILQFLSQLLRNASNKQVFNSVEALLLLLSAADDNISSLALEALAHLATPPMLHRQQAPEMQQHTTVLHSASSAAHEQLLVLARGWGSRGSGLGLYTCISSDDSQQSSLPQHAGEVHFDFLPHPDGQLTSIHLAADAILKLEKEGDFKTRFTVSTAELFFQCLKQAGGKNNIPADKLFPLLAGIRLARSFHTNATRVAAVERRLRALVCALHVHPSQEVMAGYFQAQPELCAEVVELLKPTISNVAETTRMSGDISGTISPIPHAVLVLAVEVLTALVARRDGSNVGLSPVARLANVLGELGVGKGQYVGLLPTLIRYALASLNSYVAVEGQLKNDMDLEDNTVAMQDVDLDIGMAFVQATKAAPVSGTVKEEQSLEFIDVVLTLTSAVVSIPSGTAALTDCGLIPALVSTVSLHSSVPRKTGQNGETYAECLRKFITAQAVQILEGAIVTQSSALSAFHDLNGVDLLVTRLYEEIEQVKQEGEKLALSSASVSEVETESMDVSSEQESEAHEKKRPLRASCRVLMFSIVNCLTVVLHQQEASSSRSGGAQLRKQELTSSLIEIMDNISSYGGVLASLTATLLSDVMNTDPQVVHHVHSSGLATSFLTMIRGRKGSDGEDCDWWDPTLPPSSELIMALPNVLSALSLTEEGATAVKEANPFPSLLAIFCSPQYAMPRSRCLLNDMTAVVGPGIDELMRHFPSLRPLGIKAMVSAIERVVVLGNRLLAKEEMQNRSAVKDKDSENRPSGGTVLENSRTCIMQYAFNISQLLEQILQDGDHAAPFVEAGGFEALMDLHPLLLPSQKRLLSHLSCLSNAASANLTHYTTTNALTRAIKSVASHYDAHKLIRKVLKALEVHLDLLGKKQKDVRNATSTGKAGAADVRFESLSDTFTAFCETSSELNAVGILEGVPRVALHMLETEDDSSPLIDSLSSYLREVATTEWLVTVLSATVRTACQRSQDMGSMWGGSERDQGWKAEISSTSFAEVVRKVNCFHLSAQVEVSRVRSEDGFESREIERRQPPGSGNVWHPALYRLRIVCQDGAVVRDGIEIDSCASLGSLEMGEIAEAYDRCINSSGVMRYRTKKGWISEHTRGHGREPIAEVLSVDGVSEGISKSDENPSGSLVHKRIECGIPDLCSVSASMLSRMQSCLKNLLSCLSRSVAQGMRSMPQPQRVSSQFGAHAGQVISTVAQILQLSFEVGFKQLPDNSFLNDSSSAAVGQSDEVGLKNDKDDLARVKCDDIMKLSVSGVAMYFGAVLDLLEACLYGFKPYEEKRERRTLNIPLLMSILCSDGFCDGLNGSGPSSVLVADPSEMLVSSGASLFMSKGFLGAVRFILNFGLDDMTRCAVRCQGTSYGADSFEDKLNVSRKQRLSRAVSACLPQALALMKRLTSRSQIISSHMCAVLNRMKRAELEELIGTLPTSQAAASSNSSDSDSGLFNATQFCRGLHCSLGKIVLELWTDPRLTSASPHVLYPIVSLVGEVLSSLEEGAKVASSDDISSSSGRSGSSSNNGAASSSQRDSSDVHHRLSRGVHMPAAMNIFFGGSGSASRPAPPAPFEPSEESIGLLVEMGFSRDHALEALESTESNRVEVAMEYALAHPQSSPGTLERRRVAREERRQRRAEAAAAPFPNVAATLAAARSAVSSGGNTASDSSPEEGASAGNTASSAVSGDRNNESNNGDSAPDEPSSGEAMDCEGGPASNADGDTPGSGTASGNTASGNTASGNTDEDENDGNDQNNANDKNADKKKSKAEEEAALKREIEAKSAQRASVCLAALRKDLAKVALNLIEAGSYGVCIKLDGAKTSDEQLLRGGGGSEYHRLGSVDDGSGTGDGEAETVTVVVCHFLLDICGRYPSDRTLIVRDMLTRLRSHIRVTDSGGNCTVVSGYESDFASLCHATVIFLRALPRTKALLLRYGFVGLLLQCIRSETITSKHKGKRKNDGASCCENGWPRWLSPALLLLDVIAQPTAAPVDFDESKEMAVDRDESKAGCGPKGEYTRMCLERRKHEAILCKTARDIFAAVNGKQTSEGRKKSGKSKAGNEKKQKTKCEGSSSTTTGDNGSSEQQGSTSSSDSFPSIPCYLPLMPSEESEICMLTCLRVLRHRPKKNEKEVVPPSSVVHSTLLLLARVLRSHRIASQCLKMGVAELLLSLPPACRFAGNTGLVAVIFRHLLEDEATLRTSMEAEIRGTVARLHRQQNRGTSANSNERPRVVARGFVQAVTPLICRDPVAFLKAAATSIMVQCHSNEGVSIRGPRSSMGGRYIVLLSSAERSKNLKALSDAFPASGSGNGTSSSKGGSCVKRGRSQHSRAEHRASKSKSPHHHQSSSGSPKRSRKEKHEKSGSASSNNFVVLNGTAANHVTCLLVTELVRAADREKKEEQRKQEKSQGKSSSAGMSFFRIVDYLEVLADLVLAIPACAAAIHRYRPSGSNSTARKAITDIQHALHGSPSPPSTAVSYLLHNVLPQPRSTQLKLDESSGEKATNSKVQLAEKKKCYMRVRVAQASARLLVALCARAGEGRRRVVADLSVALGGGNARAPMDGGSERELWALQSWGELCIGLAAPKSSGVNQDSNSALSWEVVKLMLENGVAHALMAGIQRVNLYHPLASGAAGALLRPMEVFTRGSVVDTVSDMVKSEVEEKSASGKKMSPDGAGLDNKGSSSSSRRSGGARRVTLGPSQRSESAFADDIMLEEGFDPDTAYRARQNARRRDFRHMVGGLSHLDDDGEAGTGDNSGEESAGEGNDEEFSDENSSDESESSEDEEPAEDYSSEQESRVAGFSDEESSDESSSSSDDSDQVDENDEEGMDVDEDVDHDETNDDGVEDEEEDEDGDDEEGGEDEDEDNDGDFGWDEDDQDFFENSVDDDDNEEVGVAYEAELEEGWTRIDSGFGGVLLSRQSASSNDSRANRRAGIVVDAAEAVIGNILSGNDIQMDALAELEDTLGIRISHRGDFEPPRASRLGVNVVNANSSGNGGGESGGTSSEGADTLNARNRGAIGSFPGVQQRRLEESGHVAYFSGRWNEMSAMDYAFGDASIAIEHENEESHPTSQDNDDDIVVPAVVDTQLFPGGPAAAIHARAQQFLHALLGDVELPSVNTMSSRLRPHGVRTGVSSRGSGSSGESGSGTSIGIFSGSGSNLLRLNRGPDGVPFLEQTTRATSSAGQGFESRWTDDGQPLDGTTADFSVAFEQALGETIARNVEAENSSRISDSSRSGEAAGEAEASGSGEVESQEPDVEGTGASAQNLESNATMNEAEASSRAQSESAGTSPSNLDGAGAALSNEGNSSEGEAVANSLASGLNLSPRSESTSASMEDSSALAGTEDAAVEPSRQNDTNEDVPEPMDTDGADSTRLDSESGGEQRSQAPEQPQSSGEQLGEQIGVASQGEADTCADAAEGSASLESDANEVVESPEIAEADATEVGQVERESEGDNAVEAEAEAEPETEAEAEPETEAAASAVAQEEGDGENGSGPSPNEHGFVCPPGMDLEVFNSLPSDMQQEVVEQHRATVGVAEQLDSASGLDPEALAALPEDVRREVIAQERLERQQPQADPSNAEEMDNASFVASLAPELREEILLTADDAVLGSLPPDLIAEAHLLRERASSQHRRLREENFTQSGAGRSDTNAQSARSSAASAAAASNTTSAGSSSRRRAERNRTGKIKVDCDRLNILFMPPGVEEESGALITASSMKALLRLMYLLSPVRPQRLLQKLLQNLCANHRLRGSFLTAFVALLNGDWEGAVFAVSGLQQDEKAELDESDMKTDKPLSKQWSGYAGDFPPSMLIGTAPDVLDTDSYHSNMGMFRRQGITTAAAIAANLPAVARVSSNDSLPPVVARRIIETLLFLSKNPRFSLEMLDSELSGKTEPNAPQVSNSSSSCLDRVMDLIGSPLYSKSSTNLEQLLNLIESVVALLSSLPKEGDPEPTIPQSDIEAAASSGKEWVTVPRPLVAQHRLRSLCSVLRLESCKDVCFQKVNTIARRLCRVEANRSKILLELATVAQGLAVDSIRDLKMLSIHLNDAVNMQKEKEQALSSQPESKVDTSNRPKVSNIPASAVTLSTTSSELKLLRVLHTLHALCGDTNDENMKKHEGLNTVTPELVSLLHSVELESLWDELSACLRVVSVLEGVSDEDDDGKKEGSDADEEDLEGDGTGAKKLQGSVAALLTRFLPTIEAFFVVNASAAGGSDGEAVDGREKVEGAAVKLNSATEGKSGSDGNVTDGGKSAMDAELDKLVGGRRLLSFVAANKVLLNALLRSNPSLLDKGLRAMVTVPQCRPFMDFDVKRQWFKTQVRRLRQHASRRHGSLRLSIRRRNVFEDAFHQLRLRNAEEMRGRLHITFRNEEGVDAGGLSREFFAILAKEMFNPNYALFTSTEDGCTFQPNPNSSINPEHLSYFRFVGRIVGKAVVDGFLLDAHFTRSLYKHMLGIKPTHHDMQAIDPDYYKNLQMILEYNLADIGLDLTFSTDDHSFGRSQTIDLIPNGRHVPVNEENKAKYVSLVCQHRMTTAIERQIKAYLEGFYELVKPELISIFTAKELELLISGMPEIDMHDLQANTEYQNYKPSDSQIIWFWNIMFSLTKSEKAAFLQFVTGSSKVPLEGFSQLQGMRGTQKFSIHRFGGSSDALVSAHTCFNALDLPVYKTEQEMRQKILYAINEGAGGFLFA